MKLFGREFSLKFAAPVQKDVELGGAGNTIFGGYITGEDYVPELTGAEAISTYERMRKSDGVVGAALLACELPIRAANWYVQPASEDDADKEIADFVAYNLFEGMSITWDDFLRQALLELPFGFMVFEKVFTGIEFNGKPMVGWRKFAPRLPSTISKWLTEAGEDGITQVLPSGGSVSIPIEKLLIFTHKKEGDNWVGISILRNSYRSWFFKGHIEKINAMAFERQGLGIPYIKLPKGYTTKDRETALKLLKNIRANEQGYMLIPEGWEAGFIDMKSKTVKDPDATIRRYNREILISVLAQFLDLGSGTTGSRALSADHSSTFHNNLTSVARQIKDVINKYAVRQLVDLNYTVAKYPMLEFSKIGIVDYEALAKSLQTLTQANILNPDEKLEEHVREIMDLPEMPDEEVEKKKPEQKPKTEDLEEADASEIILSEFSGWRSLTFAEQKVNFPEIQRRMNSAEDGLRKVLKEIVNRSANDLIRQIQIVMESPSSPERRERLKNLSVKYKGEYRRELYNATKDIFEFGKMMAAHEMRKDPPPNPASSIQDMSKSADNLTQVMADDFLKAGKIAYILAAQQKKSATETLAKVTKAIKKEVKRVIFNVPTLTVSGAINQGRRAAFEVYKKDIYALQRSEILDIVTCSFCMSVDSRIVRKNDSFARNDGFHSNCRGIWVEILKAEEVKPSISGIPKTLRERFETVNVFKPPKHPIIKKDSPAADFLKKQSQEIWDDEKLWVEEIKQLK